jgi:hypothetical protein
VRVVHLVIHNPNRSPSRLVAKSRERSKQGKSVEHQHVHGDTFFSTESLILSESASSGNPYGWCEVQVYLVKNPVAKPTPFPADPLTIYHS